MYGELLVKPWELNRMTYREIVLSIQGLRDKNENESAMFRLMTTIIASTNFGGSKIVPKIKKMWQLPGDAINKSAVAERALDTLKKFREREAINKAKQKLDAGRT